MKAATKSTLLKTSPKNTLPLTNKNPAEKNKKDEGTTIPKINNKKANEATKSIPPRTLTNI